MPVCCEIREVLCGLLSLLLLLFLRGYCATGVFVRCIALHCCTAALFLYIPVQYTVLSYLLAYTREDTYTYILYRTRSEVVCLVPVPAL